MSNNGSNVNRAIAAALFVSLFALQLTPAVAQFTGAGTQATSWVVQLFTPLVPLAVAVVGIMALAGRVNWGWFVAGLVGTALFFGRDQVVSMFRGWLGA
jgi:type IV secretory pathway VirB2 component (pilin)